MGDFYLDVSAIGNEYQAYADTPATWGVPQDGNGKAGPGHAAAVAIGTIDCASASCSGAGQLGVLGATVSSTLTGSGATLATNIAAAINASTTPVIATYSAALLPINRLVFARIHPTINTTVQIMLRIAGADWNGMTHTTAGTWGTTPTMGAFAGGADGPFAYLYNVSTVFGKSAGMSGTSYPQYGLLLNAAPGVTNPGTTDVVNLRTMRDGVSLTAGDWVTSGTLSGAWASRKYLADDGTLWSSDDGVLTISLHCTNTSSVNNALTVNAARRIVFAAKKKGGLLFDIGHSASASSNFILFSIGGAGVYISVTNCEIREWSLNVRNIVIFGDSSSISGAYLDLSNSLVVWKGVTRYIVAFYAGITNTRLIAHGLEVVVKTATLPIGAMIVLNNANINNFILEWVGGEVRDTLGVYTCQNPFNINAALSGIDLTVDGVLGITDPAIGFTPSIATRSSLRWSNPEGPNRGFRNETPQFTVDWKGNGTFPYEETAADLRGVAWSHRISWTAVPTEATPVTPIKLSRFYRSASASATVSILLYTPDSDPFYVGELFATLSYLDEDSVWRNARSYGACLIAGTPVPISSSLATWAPNGVAVFSAKVISVSTGAYKIKSGSEVMATLTLCAPKATVFYVSPELSIV